MTLQHVAAALERAESVFQRRPEAGLHDDAPAQARWTGGMRVVAGHANGTEVPTDMPTELGGTGDRVTPGWLFRAGLASCAATSIVMAAASQGIELSALEVRAESRTDSRGMLHMAGPDGAPVYAGPQDVRLRVKIAAAGVSPQRLRALVEEGVARSPVPNAVSNATAVDLQIEVETGARVDIATP